MRVQPRFFWCVARGGTVAGDVKIPRSSNGWVGLVGGPCCLLCSFF